MIDAEESSAALIDSMVAYYAFDAAAGADEEDAHGNAEDLVQTNSPPSIAGTISTARDCDIATASNFEISSGSSFEFAGSFSITGWVYIHTATASGSYQHVFSCGQSWNGGWDVKQAYNNQLAFILYSAENSAKTIHTPVSTGKWVFFTVVHDLAAKYIYAYSDNSGSLALGGSDNYTHTYDEPVDVVKVGQLQGSGTPRAYLDAFAIFNKVLSLAEIEWIYNSGSGRAYADY